MDHDEAIRTLTRRAADLERAIQYASADKERAETEVATALQNIEQISSELAAIRHSIAVLDKG